LFVPPGSDLSWRRRDAFLLASSYGPVYALVEDNGRSLYIADGVHQRDYAYDITGIRLARVGVTDKQRAAARVLISARIGEIADMYHFDPEP
jgi:hypothetical protein